MKRLKQPDLWFLIVLVAVTAVGAVLLAQAGAIQPEARHLSYSRHYWQAAFDALSATCGVGLLTYGFYEDYTPLGRWILTALGVLGAVLFLAAATAVARRMRTTDTRSRMPHPLLIVSAFLVFQALALVIYRLVGLFVGEAGDASEIAWRAIAAFSSLGWASEPQLAGETPALPAWSLALLAWLGALGWSVWLLILPPLAKRYGRARSALAVVGAYTATLLLTALLITAFESPRGVADQPAGGRSHIGAPNETLSAQPWPTRYARSLVQTAAASGAGMPTVQSGASHYPLRDTTAGTKLTLSALLLAGGLGGSATGGVQWTLLLWTLAGAAAAVGWSSGKARKVEVPAGETPTLPRPTRRLRSGQAPNRARWMHAGLACGFLLTSLAVIVALGLLLIENRTAARYQPPPTFADALLDACSVVAGGNLSSGLTDTVTGRNLLGGIRQSANLYQYGMTWLMLAMLAGRMLPLVVLCRLTDPRTERG